MTVVGTKPVPVTLATGVDPPLPREAEEMTGAGLFTWRFTAVPEALLKEPFCATTDNCVPLATCAAGTVAVTWVLLT